MLSASNVIISDVYRYLDWVPLDTLQRDAEMSLIDDSIFHLPLITSD